MRLFTLAAIAACVTSCAPILHAEPLAVGRAGDPAISGRDYLLSESNFRALLIVARHRLARYPYRPPVYEVHVIAPHKVRVYFRDEDGSANGRWLLLERVRGEWKVT